MRRILIQTLLPLVLCLIPFLVAGLLTLAVPSLALDFYIERVRESRIDWLILGLGAVMFVLQMGLAWRALRWRGNNFDDRGDHWISSLAQTAEWFPLLGLFGTVASILATFGQVASSSGTTSPQEIIRLYAPAMTATSSGLFMALLNILPSWVILLGRHLILTLGGQRSTSSSGEARL
jgi:hypothetical protein